MSSHLYNPNVKNVFYSNETSPHGKSCSALLPRNTLCSDSVYVYGGVERPLRVGKKTKMKKKIKKTADRKKNDAGIVRKKADR